MRMKGWVSLLLLLAVAPSALASGILVYEQSASASAQAGAVIARVDDPSAIFYNPAGIVFQKGIQFSFNETYIYADVKYKSPTLGTYKDNAQNFFIPAVFVTYPLSDRITFGFAVTAPYNLATDWSDDFPGRFASRHSKIVTLDYRPVVAFKINDHNAISVGLDWYDSELNLIRCVNSSALSTAINPHRLPSPPYPNAIPYYSESQVSVDTHLRDQALGFNLGYQYRNKPWSFGLFYHNRPTINYEGHTSFKVPPKLASLANLFPGQDVAVDLNAVPASARMGVAYAGDPLEVEFDVTWDQWSSWGRSKAQFSQHTDFYGTPVVKDEAFIFDWKDTYCFRLGFKYKLNDRVDLYWGALYDQAPVPDATRSPVLPDEDRWSLTIGTGWHKGHFAIDWYAMYLKFRQADVTAQNIYRYGKTGLPLVIVPGFGQVYPTNYPITPDGYYEGASLLCGITFTYKF